MADEKHPIHGDKVSEAAETKRAEAKAVEDTKAPKKAQAKEGGYVVVSEFRSIDDFSLVHEKGKPFESEDEERIQRLVEAGLIKQK